MYIHPLSATEIFGNPASSELISDMRMSSPPISCACAEILNAKMAINNKEKIFVFITDVFVTNCFVCNYFTIAKLNQIKACFFPYASYKRMVFSNLKKCFAISF